MVLHAYVSNVANVAQAEQVKKDVQQQIEGIRADMKKSLEVVAADKKQIQTPQQIVVKIPEYVPLPTPPTVTVKQDADLPNAPSAVKDGGLYFPPEDVKPLFDKLADCKADGIKLNACQQELPLMEKRAVAAEKAMKGGGFWKRLKSNGKWFLIGAAGGALGVTIAKH